MNPEDSAVVRVGDKQCTVGRGRDAVRTGQHRPGSELLRRAEVSSREAIERRRSRIDHVAPGRDGDRPDLERGIDRGNRDRRMVELDPLNRVLTGDERRTRHCASHTPRLPEGRDLRDPARRRRDAQQTASVELDHEQRTVGLGGDAGRLLEHERRPRKHADRAEQEVRPTCRGRQSPPARRRQEESGPARTAASCRAHGHAAGGARSDNPDGTVERGRADDELQDPGVSHAGSGTFVSSRDLNATALGGRGDGEQQGGTRTAEGGSPNHLKARTTEMQRSFATISGLTARLWGLDEPQRDARQTVPAAEHRA